MEMAEHPYALKQIHNQKFTYINLTNLKKEITLNMSGFINQN